MPQIPDWPTTVNEFETKFRGHHTRFGPESLRGIDANLVTNDILGYVIADGVPVEISTGTMQPLAGRVFGVTFSLEDDRNGCFDTLDEVFEHLYGEES